MARIAAALLVTLMWGCAFNPGRDHSVYSATTMERRIRLAVGTSADDAPVMRLVRLADDRTVTVDDGGEEMTAGIGHFLGSGRGLLVESADPATQTAVLVQRWRAYRD